MDTTPAETLAHSNEIVCPFCEGRVIFYRGHRTGVIACPQSQLVWIGKCENRCFGTRGYLTQGMAAKKAAQTAANHRRTITKAATTRPPIFRVTT